MLEGLTRAQFAECLGNRFRVHADAGQVLDIELIDAADLPARPRPGKTPPKRAPFSIIFRGPKNVHLSQRIYRLEHDKLGVLEIFLVPIVPDEEGMRLEAVFN